MVNLSISYLVVSTGLIAFNTDLVPWTTPVLVNAYLSTDGNLLAVALQVALLALGVAIYAPFVRHYTRTQSSTAAYEVLAEELNISTGIQAKQGIKFHEAQKFLVNSHMRTYDIIELISANKLKLYYQPKINVKQGKCDRFEALLRLEMQDGSVLGPYFLEDIEQAGLASIIDLWVCREACSDITQWELDGFNPNVSVNLHPDTLKDKAAMKEIVKMLSGKISALKLSNEGSPNIKSWKKI